MARFEFSHKNFDKFPCNYELTMDGIYALPVYGSHAMAGEPFPWLHYPEVSTGVKVQLKDDDYAGVYISLPLEDPQTDPADIKPFPAIYYVLKAARETNMDHVVCLNRVFGWSPIQFLHCDDCLLVNKAQLTDPAFNANGVVVIRVYVEPPAMATRVYSYEGFLSWSLDNFSHRKLRGLEGLRGEESPYFYTGPKGYRVRVFVRPMGDVLQVFVYFCAGEFDHELPRSFPHCTTLTLLDRKNPERNVVKRVRQDIQYGAVYYIEKRIDQTVKDIVEDDTLYYTVSIRPLKYKVCDSKDAS